jgi:hypothetical protein
VVFGLVSFGFGLWLIEAGLVATITLALVNLLFVAALWAWPNRVRAGLLAASGMLVGCFALGVWMGQSYSNTQNPTVLHVIAQTSPVTGLTNTVEGRLIRAGERAIMFYVADKKRVALIRWDGVKEIYQKK